MKSAMATRQFDRIFSRPHCSVQSLQSQSNSSSEQSFTSPETLTKEVRWKVDNSIRERLNSSAQLLDQHLAELQSTALVNCRLTLDEETLQEIRTHLLDNIEMAAKQANWRDEQNGNLDKYCRPVLDQINQLLAFLVPPLDKEGQYPAEQNNDTSTIQGIGVDGDSVKYKAIANCSCPGVSCLFVCTCSARPVHEQAAVWQFWFWRSDQRFAKWEHGLHKLGKPLHSALQMRQLVSQLIDIHEIAIPSDYSIFRESIKPKWEDLANIDGGSWIIEFERNTTEVSVIQAIWMRLLEFLFDCSYHKHQQNAIGGGGDGGGTAIDVASIRAHIRGLKISMRFKSYQISVWTDSFVDLLNVFLIGLAIQRAIGCLVDKLHLPASGATLYYRAHKVSQHNALLKEQAKMSGYDHGFFH